jgi:hypothetical protein
MCPADGPAAGQEQAGKGHALPSQSSREVLLSAAAQIVLQIQLLPAMPSSPTAPVCVCVDQAVQAEMTEALQADALQTALPVAAATQTERHAGLTSHMLVVANSSLPLSKEEMDKHVQEDEESKEVENRKAGLEKLRSSKVQVCRCCPQCCPRCAASQ